MTVQGDYPIMHDHFNEPQAVDAFVQRFHVIVTLGTQGVFAKDGFLQQRVGDLLAQFIVFEVPLQMLSDSPSIYRQEQESTDFITSIPTTFDETVPLDGEVAEYVAIARRKGDTWYVGAMTNWKPRDLTIALPFLDDGDHEAVVFADGVNAHRDATDYRRAVLSVSAATKLDVHLAPGGGWAAIIFPPRRGQ